MDQNGVRVPVSQNVEQYATEGIHSRHGLSLRSRRVLAAVFFGSFFEWYTFYLFVALACVTSRSLFAQLPWATHLSLFFLLAVGYVTRLAGAVFFGWLANRRGGCFVLRLVNVLSLLVCVTLIMLPSYYESLSRTGFAAMVVLRALQGVLLNGYTAVSVILVGKQVQSCNRGLGISLLMSACFLGCFFAFFFVFVSGAFLSRYTVFCVQWHMLPVFGIVLIVMSWPFFAELQQSESTRAMQPLAVEKENHHRSSLAVDLFILLGVGLGHGMLNMMFLFAVIYLYQVVHADFFVIYVIVSVALCAAVPCGIFFGWLSDRVGRLKVILAAFLLAGASYHGLFLSLVDSVRPGLSALYKREPIVLYGHPSDCRVGTEHNFWMFGLPEMSGVGCSFVRTFFDYYGLNIRYVATPHSHITVLRIGQRKIEPDTHVLMSALAVAGYPLSVHFHAMHTTQILLIFALLLIYVSMVRAPVVVYLFENMSHRRRNFLMVGLSAHGNSLWMILLCVSGLFWRNPAFQLYQCIVLLAGFACFASILVSVCVLKDAYDPLTGRCSVPQY